MVRYIAYEIDAEGELKKKVVDRAWLNLKNGIAIRVERTKKEIGIRYDVNNSVENILLNHIIYAILCVRYNKNS